MGQDDAKRQAGTAAAGLIEAGMRVGLGTGTTAAELVRALGRRMAAEPGLRFEAACTSSATEALAREHGIPIIEAGPGRPLALYIDGADEVDPQGRLIKGHGGALLREKLVAGSARRHVIMIDATKPVRRLGEGRAVPVEVVRFAHEATRERIEALGCRAVLRCGREGAPFVTDEGHLIYDATFAGGIGDPEDLEGELKSLLGVVETGLFIGYCQAIVLGRAGSARVMDLAEFARDWGAWGAGA